MINKNKEIFPQSNQSNDAIPWWSVPIIVFIFTVSIFSFVGRTFVIPSESMMPTLIGCQGCNNDRIIAGKIPYYFSNPKQGDVIVFRDNGEWGLEKQHNDSLLENIQEPFRNIGLGDSYYLVKRIAATEGQTIQCLPGDPGIMVDGKKLLKRNNDIDKNIQYRKEEGSLQCRGPYFGPITVEKDRVFVLGDNSQHSADSRYHLDNGHNGTIPEDNIYGKANIIFYPIKRIGSIE